jgi:FMN reductase [NAD(P)H]
MRYENEVMKCLYERGSVRSFEDKDISKEVLEKVINAGCHAATGGNLQPYSIIEIRSSEQKKALMDTGCMQSIVEKALVSLLFVIDWHRIERWAKLNNAPCSILDGYRHFWIGFQDTVIAAQNICTAADSMGLGSVYLGTVESCFDELKPMFDLPDGVFPVVLLCLGYPKQSPKIQPKHLYDIMVHKEKYHEISDDELNECMDQKYSDRAKTPLSDNNKDKLKAVCEKVHDKEFADAALEYAKSLGYIHMAQRYFGLHYRADEIRTGNSAFINSLRNYGFKWVDGIDYD